MKMKTRDHSKLLAELTGEYTRRFPASQRLHRQACRTLIDGGSHNLRLIEPFPPRIRDARVESYLYEMYTQFRICHLETPAKIIMV